MSIISLKCEKKSVKYIISVKCVWSLSTPNINWMKAGLGSSGTGQYLAKAII